MVFFKKSYPAPDSLDIEFLKPNGSYNNEDVLSLLHSDFKNKCYLCESKGIESINIEHFAPHKHINKIRKFDWSNLFWACSHCNKIKSAKEPLLNCTMIDENVDTKIKFLLNDDLTANKVVIEAISNDSITTSTVQLLQDIYTGTTSQNKFQAREKRNKLYDEMSEFTSLLLKYIRTEDLSKKDEWLINIKNELSNKSQFTAFKRWFIKTNLKFRSLEQYIVD
jgi:hypothetical protein